MKQFLYVQAIVTNAKIVDPTGQQSGGNPGAIRFRHTVVEAEDETGAYTAGGLWSDANPPWPGVEGRGRARSGYRPDLETINDYVVELT